jgi:polyketide synthase 13
MDSTQVQHWLQQRIASLLEVSVDEIDTRSPLENFGLGSKDATGMVAELDTLLDVRLPATLLYEHETIHALAAHIAQVVRAHK